MRSYPHSIYRVYVASFFLLPSTTTHDRSSMIERMSVLLPLPMGPITATCSPWGQFQRTINSSHVSLGGVDVIGCSAISHNYLLWGRRNDKTNHTSVRYGIMMHSNNQTQTHAVKCEHCQSAPF